MSCRRRCAAIGGFFLNIEVERYTLATGETVLTGFNRLWRHWGLLFAVMGYFANLWAGWAISSATLTSYLFGAIRCFPTWWRRAVAG